MPSVMKFFNLLVASICIGLVCLTSGFEVGKTQVAPPHVLSVSTSWHQSTRGSSVLFTNNSNEFVIDEACHTQELSSVWVFIFHLYNSLSSSLGDLQLIFFKQGTFSGAAIEESFHWMHYDIRDTILISAGLSFCTAILVVFISWIRPASRPSYSFHTKQAGRQVHPRIVRSSPDAESSGERWVDPRDQFPLVIESQTAQESKALDIDKSKLLPTDEYSREISATKTHGKIQQKYVQCASGRSMPPLQFSVASHEALQSTPQQTSSIIIPGRLSQLQPSLQLNESGGSVPLQRPHQPVRYVSSGSGQPKQSSHVAYQNEGLPEQTELVSLKISSKANFLQSPVFIQKPQKPISLTFRDSIPLNALQCKGYGRLNQPQQASLLPIGSLMQSNQQPNSSLNNSTLNAQQGSGLAQLTAQKTLKSSQQNELGRPVLVQRPPIPIGLKFRDSIPLNALQLKGYRGLLNAQF